jgi:hypothetical protein
MGRAGWCSALISCSSRLISVVSALQRSTRSRAIRATVPSRPARRSASRARLRGWLSVRAAGSLPGSSSCRCQRSRLIMRVRSPTRSSRWSTSRRSSRSGPSSLAIGRSGSRSAARATASASIGSLFPNERAPSRAFAISFGGTRTIRSPAASRSRSRRRERCRQSSIAQRRSAKRAAQATSSR